MKIHKLFLGYNFFHCDRNVRYSFGTKYKSMEDDRGFGHWNFSKNFINERHKYEKQLDVPEFLSEEDYLFSKFFKKQDVIEDQCAVLLQENSELNDVDNSPSYQVQSFTQKDSTVLSESAAGSVEKEVDHMEVTNSLTVITELVSSFDEQTLSKEQLSELSEKTLSEVLPQLSDAGLCHICSLMCMMPAQQHNKLGGAVSCQLLLPRLQTGYNEPCSRVVSEAIVNFVKIFPHVSSSEVLLPLMSAPDTACGDLLLQIIREAFTPQQREQFLRAFLQSGPDHLYEWQIGLLHELLDATSRDDTLQLVIQRMNSSCEQLSRNIHFAKLLVHVIQLIGSTASKDIYEQLAIIINSNKSVLKKAAEKALRSLDK